MVWANIVRLPFGLFLTSILICVHIFHVQSNTRQLPMGAGHCQWGGLTDRNICNIYGGAHLASRYHVRRSIGCDRRECDTHPEGRKES